MAVNLSSLTAVGPVTVKLPLVSGLAAGAPSLKTKFVQVRGVEDESAPTTSKLIFISVPEPESATVLNATIRILPGVAVLGVMVHPALNVPVVLKAGFCNWRTLVLKVNVKS